MSNLKLQEHIKMLDTVKGLVEDQFPVTSRNGRTLTATNFRWDQMGEQVFNDLKAQKAAKLGEKGVVSRLMADVTITDEDGSTIDSKMGHVLMNMPHLTPRNSYIVEGGGEVQVINQLRLRPGVYSHVKGDDEVEAHLNTSAAGTYKVLLDRKTGVIRFKVGTDKKVPIVVVMRALGASETEITETLGELADTNVKIANFDKDTTKLLTSLNRYAKVGSTLENQVAVKDFLHSKPMDAKVNNTTLGVDKGDKIDLAVVKGTVRKVMGLSKGRGKEDDKESLEFKSLHTIEDFVPERLQRASREIGRMLPMLLQRKDSVPAVLPMAIFNNPVNKLMTQSEFTRYSDQNNPIDMAAISTAVTVMGEGGIGSSRAITNDVRAIHPSQFGVIDVLHVPEGQKVGVTTHLSYGAKKVGNSIHITAYNAKTGKAEQMAVEELMPKVVAFGDQYANMGKGVKPVLKEGVDKGKIKVRHNTDIKEVPATEVEYIFNDAATFFSSSSSVIPFLNSNSANRVLMADKHIEQTVQLADPDAPLVQHRLKGLGSGYMDAFGEQFLVKSPIKGTVQKVTEDAIFISPSGGGKRVEVTIHNHYPLNSKTYLDDTPTVNVGDKVTKGQALVKNNFTKNKTLALGKNLTTAMIPYKGYNFEDGTVISYAAAQKLASVHKAEHRVELGSNVTTGIESYVAHFPQNLEKLGGDYAERYDSQGVIKKGQKVTKGDILIPALREVSLSKTELSDLHRKVLATTHTDISATWDKDVDGEITDVVRNRKFIKVYVKSVEPAQIGDKLSAFAGAKGIITKILGPEEVYKDANGDPIDVLFNPFGCYDSKTEVLTERGWEFIKDVKVGDKVMAMDPVTQEARLEAVEHTTNREYEGAMYHIKNGRVDLVVTPNHRMYTRKSSKVRHGYEITEASEVAGQRRNYKKNAESWAGQTPGTFTLGSARTGTGPKAKNLEVNGYDFARFVGLLIGDGWSSQSVSALDRHSYKVFLCQSETKAEVCEYIEELLERLPWTFTKTYREDRGMFEWQCSHKELHAWLTEHMGVGAKNKRIPRELLSWDSTALQGLLDGLIMTDGNIKWNAETGHYGTVRYFTSSEGLADDVQELALRIGASAHITQQLRKAGSGLSNHDSLIYTVSVLKSHEPPVNFSAKTKESQQEGFEAYVGTVHCVTVQSGLIYVRRNNIPVWSGNSVGRINPGFLLEAAAGKVAAKTGKTFYTDNFEREHDNNLEHVKSEMRKAGVNDAETITNAAGHKIENVMVGPIHTLKLKHKISDKFSARGAGGAYTALDQPKKISGESAQRIGSQDMFSLLSGDAMAFLDDAYRLKGQKNDDYWRALQLGHTLPEPKAPFVAQKFTAMLMASGVNLKQEGSRLDASPMTDAEVMKLSHGEVKNPGTLRSPNLRPMKGGLFDEGMTGGPGGSRWTHIELKKPIVNPLMKEAVISVGNFKSGAELERVLDGTLSVDDQGRVLEDDSGTFGIDGVIKVLDSINVQEEIEKTNEAANNARATALNKLNRRLRYLTALKEMNLSPKEAYINSKIPVLPPKFRQITEMPDGSVSVADANHGYRELIMINNQVGDLKELGYDEKTLARLEKSLAQSAGALAGRNAFVTRGREYRGLIEEVNGVKESKYGYFKSKVMSRSQDLSARSTVIPNPKLGLDDVGIPKKMGLTIYGPFVVKRLVQGGVAPLDARQMVKDGEDRALDALQLEIEERPVLLSRAPSLHKFSMIGLKPKLVDGKAIEINPLVVAGLNMDFDGDTAGVHVPVSEDARRETLTKMLPSQALVSPRDEFVIHGPSKETVLGIYKLTKPEGEPKSMTMKEAEAQFKKGKLAPNVAIKAGKSVQCYGQKMFNDVFPAGIKPGMRPITGKDLDKILLDVSKETDAKESARILTEIKDLGNQYVTELGYAVSLKDLEFDYKKRDAVIKKLERNSQTKGFGKAVGEATDELSALLAEAVDNRFVEATLESKATGKGDAVRQMIATPVAVTDNKGKLIPIPIRKSFAEGHDLGAYLGTTPGARQGLIDKGISVGATGYLSKLLVRANIENKISQEDCGTTEYIMLPTDSSDAINRYGAVANFRNVPLTSAMLRKIKREGTKDIAVRSALKCKAQEGICGKCAGIDENGRPYTIGFHLGTQAAQSIGERATQVTLQKFHTGGAVGGASVGFNRIEQLLQLPETVRGRAVLAPESGRITKIEKAPAGGNFVFVNQSGKVFVPQELGLSVKVGDNVKAGDQLTQQGVLKPQDLLSATGDMNKVQDTLIDELGAAYGKQRINRRTFETIVKPMTDKVKISNSGDGGTIYNVFAGDIQSKNQIEEYNRKLRERGLREIQFEPILAGIKKIPFLSDDFVGALTHERLKGTLAEAPGMGKSTDFGSGHPVSQLTMKQFGNIADVRGPRPNRL